MAQVIPVDPSLPSWRQQTELDGVLYELSFSWNDRDGSWFLTVRTVDGETISAGMRLVPNWPLLRKVRHEDRPPGELMVFVGGGQGITRENLGEDAVLAYIPAEDLQEFLGG